MKKHLLIILFITFTICFTHAQSRKMMLKIISPSEDFFSSLNTGNDPLIQDTNKLLISGIINNPDFVITDINNITITDQNGQQIPLVIDKSSIYHEFDETEINGLTIAFVIDATEESTNSYLLKWGEDITAENTTVDKISAYSSNQNQYRIFSLEAQKESDTSSTYAATLEIVVDDFADTYYLWYLLPMVLIFILLFVRKVTIK